MTDRVKTYGAPRVGASPYAWKRTAWGAGRSVVVVVMLGLAVVLGSAASAGAETIVNLSVEDHLAEQDEALSPLLQDIKELQTQVAGMRASVDASYAEMKEAEGTEAYAGARNAWLGNLADMIVRRDQLWHLQRQETGQRFASTTTYRARLVEALRDGVPGAVDALSETDEAARRLQRELIAAARQELEELRHDQRMIREAGLDPSLLAGEEQLAELVTTLRAEPGLDLPSVAETGTDYADTRQATLRLVVANVELIQRTVALRHKTLGVLIEENKQAAAKLHAKVMEVRTDPVTPGRFVNNADLRKFM